MKTSSDTAATVVVAVPTNIGLEVVEALVDRIVGMTAEVLTDSLHHSATVLCRNPMEVHFPCSSFRSLSHLVRRTGYWDTNSTWGAVWAEGDRT